MLRHAQLRIVSPALEVLGDMPEHLRTVVAGIFKELDDNGTSGLLPCGRVVPVNKPGTTMFWWSRAHSCRAIVAS